MSIIYKNLPIELKEYVDSNVNILNKEYFKSFIKNPLIEKAKKSEFKKKINSYYSNLICNSRYNVLAYDLLDFIDEKDYYSFHIQKIFGYYNINIIKKKQSPRQFSNIFLNDMSRKQLIEFYNKYCV